MVGVVRAQTFGLGNAKQAVVGTDERQRCLTVADQIPVERPGSRQLYCVIGPQRVQICQPTGGVNCYRHNVQQSKPVRDVIVKRSNCRSVVSGQQDAISQPPGKGARGFYCGQLDVNTAGAVADERYVLTQLLPVSVTYCLSNALVSK